MSKDNFCFTEDAKSCIDGALFVDVDEASDIEKDKFSGIVGLAPVGDGRIPAFVEQMAGMGGVGGKNEVKPLFSIFLS